MCSHPDRAGSLITPGGIATWVLVQGVQQVLRVRSLPLEGSQHEPWVTRFPVTGGSLITPGGIATGCLVFPQVRGRVRSLPLEGSQRVQASVVRALGIEFAHYPWRDRNSCGRAWTLSSGSRSLITPGGIATTSRRRVADSWSGSLITPGGIATEPRRTFRFPKTGSLITPGGIATLHPRSRRQSPPQVRSLPLEGSQHVVWGDVTGGSGFAHYPWRDRNPMMLDNPGPAAKFAHYPWRDRNKISRMESV